MSFGFRQPYQVLIDSEMCKTATEHKIELVKQLGTVLQGEVKPSESYPPQSEDPPLSAAGCKPLLFSDHPGKSQQPAVDLAKEFERRKCNHREPIPGDECLASVIGETNKHRYVVATQMQPLRVKLRAIPAVPIVHVNRSVMVLEPPSDATLKTKALTEAEALRPTAPDLALVPPKAPVQPVHKKKGPKAPNPLSMKKKKPKTEGEGAGKKDKGKGKATPNGVSKISSHESTGEKRKRTSAEDEDAQPKDDAELSTLEPEGGHKRKRRRKKAPGLPADAQ
ncbi:hypothetical protein HWV62_44355 [Athelia sp. TMB]|nr:hypothetical protein HWV62_44355 [Athelia sp. TMB]